MKLIIEGPDLAGKTTAIEKIAKHYNSGFIIKNCYKPKNLAMTDAVYTQYWKILAMIDKLDFKDVVILDRFYPSQAVYSYLRGRDDIFAKEIDELDDFCKLHDFVYIYLDTDLDTLKDRYKQRGDEHIKIGNLINLKVRYDTFYEYTKLRKYKVDTTEENWLEKLTEELK